MEVDPQEIEVSTANKLDNLGDKRTKKSTTKRFTRLEMSDYNMILSLLKGEGTWDDGTDRNIQLKIEMCNEQKLRDAVTDFVYGG